MISIESKKKITEFGSKIRKFRLEKNESQSTFAIRLGISIPTLRKMENGDDTVAIGTWVEALSVLGRLSDMDSLLQKRESLFEIRDAQNKPTRQRASKKSYL